jgi:hypothetical protein
VIFCRYRFGGTISRVSSVSGGNASSIPFAIAQRVRSATSLTPTFRMTRPIISLVWRFDNPSFFAIWDVLIPCVRHAIICISRLLNPATPCLMPSLPDMLEGYRKNADLSRFIVARVQCFVNCIFPVFCWPANVVLRWS